MAVDGESGVLVKEGVEQAPVAEVEADATDNHDPETGEPAAKKRKAVNATELRLLENLPAAERYERSYMHRDILHSVHCTPTMFIVTASVDGHVKFWKKREIYIEFVKHFRAHIGGLLHTAVSADGVRYATTALDRKVKIFDVINFDMINMISLDVEASLIEWIYTSGSTLHGIAVVEKESNIIRVYDSTSSSSKESALLDKIHFKGSKITAMRFCPTHKIVITADSQGMIEFWNSEAPYEINEDLFEFKYKMQTDLYDLAKNKAFVMHIAVSPDGEKFSAYGSDRIVRVFKLRKGKIWRQFDETLKSISEQQKNEELINEMDFGRKMANEKELPKHDKLRLSESIFDESGRFFLYSTLWGVRVISLRTGACIKIIGLTETFRPLSLALCQGSLTEDKRSAALTLDMKAASNPALAENLKDPTLFVTAHKSKRFYLFTQRELDGEAYERDIFNEKPTKEESVAAAQTAQARRLATKVCLRTSMGDIYIKLFKDKVPKTVENFVVHVRNGYYNNHIFHRVIKGFMIQTGCPLGTGTGGESIWGGEFEDEILPELRHKKPFTVSMANAGPNSNGSQFFITVCPCPWLDNKHTIFGEIYQGMENVLKISQAPVDNKTDKPWDDMTILNASVVN